MKEEIPLDLLVKYLHNECSGEEIEIVRNWLKADPGNIKILNELNEIQILTSPTNTLINPDTENEWQRIVKRAGIQNIPLKKRSFLKIQPKIWRLAAAFLFICASFAVYNLFFTQKSQNMIEIYSSGKEIEQHILPDKSHIWLSPQSKVAYPESFSNNKREIILHGEAFFDIAKDSMKPFIIQAGKTKVVILGTSFTYRSFIKDNQDILIVNSGKVAFYDQENISNYIIVEAGYTAIYDYTSKTIQKMKTSGINLFALKTGKMIFENENLGNIALELSKYYKKEISLKDSLLKNIKLTVTFDNLPINQALKMLEVALDIKTNTISDTIVIKRAQ
jgi:transmembrane sensor